MFSYCEIIRPLNCLMTAIAVFIGGIIVAGADMSFYSTAPIWTAMIAAFLIAGGGNTINDYTDIEADRINRPKRPIPSGRISPKSAFLYSIILFILGIILAGFINYLTFIIALINSIVLIIYSFSLQHKFLLGNIAISYLVGSTFLFGGAVLSPALSSLLAPALFALMAFLANLSREIVKDIEDFEGDRQSFLKKFAKKIKEAIAERIGLKTGELKHKKQLKILAAISLILAVLISPLPYLWKIFSINYLYVVWLTDLLFLYAAVFVLRIEHNKSYRAIGRRIKLGMLFGLIAFLVGALF